jgi:hypothetical protein
MPNDPTTTGNGPWRLLVLDRDPADPKWILATVATPGDVRPAWPSGTVDEDTAIWVGSPWPLACTARRSPACATRTSGASTNNHRRTETAPARTGIVAEAEAENPAETRATDVNRIS